MPTAAGGPIAQTGRDCEFYSDRHGLWFGIRPETGLAVDVVNVPLAKVDDLQVLQAVRYLQRVGRDGEAARLVATQTGCSASQARKFCHSHAGDPDAAFGALPWKLAAQPKPPFRWSQLNPSHWKIDYQQWGPAIVGIGAGSTILVVLIVVFVVLR